MGDQVPIPLVVQRSSQCYGFPLLYLPDGHVGGYPFDGQRTAGHSGIRKEGSAGNDYDGY
jgi:hypothetical protein